MGQVKPGELYLSGMMNTQLVQEEIIEWTVVLEFEGADGVGYALDRIRLPMGPVIGGIDAPLVFGSVMAGMEYAVHDWIAQIYIARRPIYFGPEGMAPFREPPGPHPLAKLKNLFFGAV